MRGQQDRRGVDKEKRVEKNYEEETGIGRRGQDRKKLLGAGCWDSGYHRLSSGPIPTCTIQQANFGGVDLHGLQGNPLCCWPQSANYYVLGQMAITTPSPTEKTTQWRCLKLNILCS